jgi:hypothetical protein
MGFFAQQQVLNIWQTNEEKAETKFSKNFQNTCELKKVVLLRETDTVSPNRWKNKEKTFLDILDSRFKRDLKTKNRK